MKQNEFMSPDSSIDDISLLSEDHQDIPKDKTMLCPDCWNIPLVNLDESNHKVSYSCDEGHQNELKIDEFLKLSLNHSITDVTCSLCHQYNISPLQSNLDYNNPNKIGDNYNNPNYYLSLKFCMECRNFFCKKCEKKHGNTFGNEHHLLPSSKLNTFCIEHDEPYSIYCKTCHKNLCNNCIGHDTHEMVSLNMINIKSNEITKMKQNIWKLRTEYKKIDKNFREILDELLTKFHEIMQLKMYELQFKENILMCYDLKPTNYSSLYNANILNTFYEPISDNFSINNISTNLLKNSSNSDLYQQVNDKIMKIANIFDYLKYKKDEKKENLSSFNIPSNTSSNNGSFMSSVSLSTINKLNLTVNNKYNQNNKNGIQPSNLFSENKILTKAKTIPKGDINIDNSLLLRNKIKFLTIKEHRKEIMNMIKLNNGNFATASWDGSVKIFDGKTYKLIQTIKEPHDNDVCYISQLSDDSILICSNIIQKIRLINNDKNFIIEQTLRTYKDYIIKAIELENKNIITCDWEYKIKVWSLQEANGGNKKMYKLIVPNLNEGEHLSSICRINGFNFVSSSNSHLENGKDCLRFFDENFNNESTIEGISCSELPDSLCQINKDYLAVALQKWKEGQTRGISIINIKFKQITKTIHTDALTFIGKLGNGKIVSGGREQSSKRSMIKIWSFNNCNLALISENCTEQKDAITSVIELSGNVLASSNYDSTIALLK